MEVMRLKVCLQFVDITKVVAEYVPIGNISYQPMKFHRITNENRISGCEERRLTAHAAHKLYLIHFESRHSANVLHTRTTGDRMGVLEYCRIKSRKHIYSRSLVWIPIAIRTKNMTA